MSRRVCAALTVLMLLPSPGIAAGACQASTPALEAMTTREIQLVASTGRSIALRAKIARRPEHRAAGFQHVCAATVAATAILFEFERVTRPGFHMRNVHAPLDIAFIDDAGVIREIHTMQPYVLGAAEQRIWRPRVPVRAALEADAGYFRRMGVEPGSWSVHAPR